jgi:hypothetical protein
MACGSLVVALAFAGVGVTGEWVSGIKWREPAVVTPGATPADPPSDAQVLFDGTNLDLFKGGDKWVVENGVATAKGGGLTSKESFGDCQLHIEWAAPEKVEGKGQGRGNSGVYLMGQYEIQILDSSDNPTYFDGQAASLYKSKPPLVNASKKPGEWQAYDIIFNAPKFSKEGALLKPGHVTVLHNGVLVQNHTEILGSTAWDSPPKYTPHAARAPFQLQFHGNPVRFRNIWIREIPDITCERP